MECKYSYYLIILQNIDMAQSFNPVSWLVLKLFTLWCCHILFSLRLTKSTSAG